MNEDRVIKRSITEDLKGLCECLHQVTKVVQAIEPVSTISKKALSLVHNHTDSEFGGPTQWRCAEVESSLGDVAW